MIVDTTLNQVVPVDAGDRLSFTLFLAIALHGLIILGVSFTTPPKTKGSQTLEITLATHKSLKAPNEADFLAQHNQQGSGTEAQARQLTSMEPAVFADTQVRELVPLPQVAASAPDKPSPTQVLMTRGASDVKYLDEKKLDPDETQENPHDLPKNPTAMSAEIASLQAKLAQQSQEYAKLPRLRTLTSVSTKESFDAQYLLEWGDKIERIGNHHYPQEALNKHITGKLRLSVIINSDGSIYQIEVLQSSGKHILDDAARQIVRLSSPFSAFSPELRLHADRLQIIRTWNFEISGLSTSER